MRFGQQHHQRKDLHLPLVLVHHHRRLDSHPPHLKGRHPHISLLKVGPGNFVPFFTTLHSVKQLFLLRICLRRPPLKSE